MNITDLTLCVVSIFLAFVLLTALATYVLGAVDYLYNDKIISKGETFTLEDTELRILGDNAIIVAGGTIHLNNVTVTSWNNTSQGPIEYPNHRGYIFIQRPDSDTSITNSTLIALGYHENGTAEPNGLVYYDSLPNRQPQTHIIRNNNFTQMFDGLFTKNFSNIVMENNIVANSARYGIDPHTGSTDMIFRNNTVYNNPAFGIICSLDCKNITIAANTVHDNGKGQIMLSRNTNDSVVIGNTVYGSNHSGISVSESHSNSIKDNHLRLVKDGIDLKANASLNTVEGNRIEDYERSGIRVLKNTTNNEIINNVVDIANQRDGHPVAINPGVRGSTVELNNTIVHPIRGPLGHDY